MRTAKSSRPYDKFHYVPFGEYMPLRRWLPIVKRWRSGCGADRGSGAGDAATARPSAREPLICYEVIFPHAVTDPADRPTGCWMSRMMAGSG